MHTFSVEKFMMVEYKYLSGNLSQMQALEELNKEYKAGLRFFKKKMTEKIKENEFYTIIPGGIKELISIHDKIMNRMSELERKENESIYRNIIKDFLEEKTSKNTNGQTTKALDFDLVRTAIYQERDEIANLCQEKRMVDEYYKKYVAQIQGTPPKTTAPDIEQHYFLQILKNDAKQAFEVMKNAIQKGLVEYKDNYFNFKCDKGCVGLFFAEAGYTDYKRISQHIRINGEKCDLITLQNAKKNTPPHEWQEIKRIIFGTTIK